MLTKTHGPKFHCFTLSSTKVFPFMYELYMSELHGLLTITSVKKSHLMKLYCVNTALNVIFLRKAVMLTYSANKETTNF